jgi:hypothetical protein
MESFDKNCPGVRFKSIKVRRKGWSFTMESEQDKS